MVDVQQNLQAMIDDDIGALYFPPGTYKLGSTLTFPERTGHHLVGCGLARRLDDDRFEGPQSVLFWAGNSTDPMIEYQGARLVWNGLTLWGRESDTGTRAAVGIKIKQPTSSPVTAAQ